MSRKTITIRVLLLITIVCLVGFFTSCTKKYTVIFDSCGGTVVETISVKNKKTVQKPTDPQKEGYTFEYWSLNGEYFDFSTKITSDITLVAVWKQILNEPTRKIMTPKNVKINENVVSWDAVEGATGYIVYVDGSAVEVSNTMYTLTNIDKIEVLICVVAKDINSVSKLSTSVAYRKELDNAKVQEVIAKFDIPTTGYEESAKELAYALEKYDITPEEVLGIVSEISKDPAAVLKLLQLENAKEMLEVVAIYECILTLIQLDQQVSIFSKISESTHTLIETLYRDLISNELYSTTTDYEKYSDDIVFATQLAPYVLYATAQNISYADIILDFIDCGIVSIYRNGSNFILNIPGHTEFVISNEQIKLYNAYFCDLNTIQLENYRDALGELYSYNLSLILNSQTNSEAMLNLIESQLNDLRSCILVNADEVICAIKQVLTVQEKLTPIINEFENVVEIEDIVSDIALLPTFLEQVVSLKDQAIDIIISLLPTSKQCEALDSILQQLRLMNINFLDETYEYAQNPYGVVEALNKVLIFLKSIDTKNYNLESIFKAYVFNYIIDYDTANNEVAKLVNNLFTTLKDAVTSYGVSENDLITILSKYLSQKYHSYYINFLQTMFGFEINEEQVSKVISILTRFLNYIGKQKITANDVSKIFETIPAYIKGDVSFEQLIYNLVSEVVLPKIIDYINEDLIDEVDPYLKNMTEFINLTEDASIDGEKLVTVLKDNVEAIKDFSYWLFLRMCFEGNYDGLEPTLNFLIKIASDETKLNGISKLIIGLQEVLGKYSNEFFFDFFPDELYYEQLTDANLLTNLTKAKQLVGKNDDEITNEDWQAIKSIGSLIEWSFPAN